VELRLWNRGTSPWTPTHAQLLGPGVRWDARVWPPEPLAPGNLSRVLVEVEVPGLVPPGALHPQALGREGDSDDDALGGDVPVSRGF